MSDIVIGMVVGFIFGCLAGALGNMANTVSLIDARYDYLRCTSDGGTPQHCIERYFMGKEP